ncbi:MAG: preprotein translocase subunit SecE, partial [Octadecabacter sp.]
MAKTNPVQFIQQTRAEIGKVVWPSRREVTLTTIMVLIMA